VKSALSIIKALTDDSDFKLQKINDKFIGRKDIKALTSVRSVVSCGEKCSIVTRFDSTSWLMIFDIELSKSKNVDVTLSFSLDHSSNASSEDIENFERYGLISNDLSYTVSCVAYNVINGHHDVKTSKDFMIRPVDGSLITSFKMFSSVTSLIKRL
jgi:hypothetical protein